MANTPSNTFIKNYTSGPVLRSLITFAIPLFLSNLLQAVYNLVDMVVVGQVVGAPGLSGISVGGDVLALLTFLSMGFSDASQVIISMYIGSGLRDKLSRFIGTMSTFLILCAIGMATICLLLREQILSIMNTPPESWDQAMAYGTTCMFGLVFIYGYNIVSSIMRGLGDSKRPFLFIAIAAVLNVILDLIFVVGFRWEAFGAALATVIAQAVSFLIALFYLCRHRERFGFDFTPRNFIIDPKELIILVKLGIPMAIRQASVLISKFFIISARNRRALFNENANRSAFSPRFGMVNVTLSKRSAAVGITGTMTSRASSPEMLSTMCCMATESNSSALLSMPVARRMVCMATIEPWRMRM